MSAPLPIWPCLGLDTSTRNGVLVIADKPAGQQAAARLDPAITHGRDLVPAIGRMMTEAGLGFDAVRSIAVGIGPGSYTGLRVGLAVAKTLAEVLAGPVFPVDSLLLCALNLPQEINKTVVVADAQRGAVYESLYKRDGQTGLWRCHSGPIISPWNDLQKWQGQGATLTGPGLGLIAKLGPPDLPLADMDLWAPSAASMFAWIKDYADQAIAVDHMALEPLYIRPSAAEEKRQEQATR